MDAPLGSFEEHVVLAVLRTGDRAYGMEVRREIAAVTGRDVTIGAVYATLDRLESKSLLASARASVDESSRRVFRVTAAGSRVLAETRRMREGLWRGIEPGGSQGPA